MGAEEAGSDTSAAPAFASSSSVPGASQFKMTAGTPTEHAVISVFDLFSIGIGPSSSHTLGPMRAGAIFATELQSAGLLERVHRLQIHLYGSLAATGEGHYTPRALLLGIEGVDAETVDTAWAPKRYQEILDHKQLCIGQHLASSKQRAAAAAAAAAAKMTDEARSDPAGQTIAFDYKTDLKWMWGEVLPMHSNGLRLTVFDEAGDMLATNDFASVGGGFVINGAMSVAPSSKSANVTTSDEASTGNAALQSADPQNFSPVPSAAPASHPVDLAENLFYKGIDRRKAEAARRLGAEAHREGSSDSQESSLKLPTSAESVARVEEEDRSVSEPLKDAGSKANGTPTVPYVFWDAASLLALTRKHNMTIAQIVWENEVSLGYSPDQLREKLLHIWDTMDTCIYEGVHSSEETLPGALKLRRRAPALYARLTRGFFSGSNGAVGASKPKGVALLDERVSVKGGGESDAARPSDLPALSEWSVVGSGSGSGNLRRRARSSGPPRVVGRMDHPLLPTPPRRLSLPGTDFLSCYAIAVNEVNASGGRVVVAPTMGAAGVIPAVLKYTLEFYSEDEERDVLTFLLTAGAIGMLFKRGATISAAEGGCMAEVGSSTAMAAAAFAACMGGSPATIEQAAEIGIEHSIGLSCDPPLGLVQVPCIERNALGAAKAVVSAQLALSETSESGHAVSLDEALAAMRSTAQGMRSEFKETSLGGLATAVRIPVSVPAC
ncbi:L-SERINE DEHYDRATASE 1-RELATED [Ceraceosorus bombacis]|uniref:L-SERINE DEHYDRATASE 1-RELATED n=1 Tax=Ceraceosorus bombacis TaxID=401625 RepID=A0A0P1BC63_9BASI|nr:L-SERINE DEHYDRATASE 1-RELATED [Ceraceosorus bombacis]